MLELRHTTDGADSERSEPTSTAHVHHTLSAAHGHFLDWIDRPAFPCVGAKAALARDAIATVGCGTLGSVSGDRALHAEITAFGARIANRDRNDTTVHSLAAIFAAPTVLDEYAFEARLWAQLQRLHDIDVAAGTPWAEGVGTDPDSAGFSLSIGGRAFFVIGLHPGASRRARRYRTPVLVFNSHEQFEDLRANGMYQKMQQATRQRDIALQGDINPNLADFGTAPETRQYSGRRVETDWRCPFRVRRTSDG